MPWAGNRLKATFLGKGNLMRINKYLSEAGLCSRREADRLIREGRVTVEGVPARAGMQVEESAEVCVDGRPVRGREKKYT